MKKKIFYLGLILAFSFVLKANAANEYWQTLDGPYWVNGIDVAYGPKDLEEHNAWYRYLVGCDGIDVKPFNWNPLTEIEKYGWWARPPITSANKVITYKIDGYGQIAFLSAYGDRIYYTANGGGQWDGIPHSDDISNKHFTSIEVPNSPDNSGYVVMLAAEAMPEASSAFYTEDGSSWLSIGGTSTIDKEIYDIEAFPAREYPPEMAMGTPDGILVKASNYGNQEWSDSWVRANFPPAGWSAPVLESIDMWDGGNQIGALIDPQGHRALYITRNYWATDADEIKINSSSFDKEVRDIAAPYFAITSEPISCYVATSEGIYLLDLRRNNGLLTATQYDLKNLTGNGCEPLRYDQDIKAVDYHCVHTEDGHYNTTVLATTPYNVYQIFEVRNDNNFDIESITVTDASAGTYPANVTGLSFTGTYPDQNPVHDQEVFTVADNGIIKNHDFNRNSSKWQMVGLANDSTEPNKTGTDVATIVIDDDAYVLVSSKGEDDGLIMYSDNDGTTWEEHSPNDGSSIINSVSFDPVSAGEAYAAGIGVWQTDMNGFNWSNMWGSTSPPPFNDIISDWNYPLERNYYFAGGSGSITASMYYDGAGAWETIHQGLAATDIINQFAVATIGGILTNHSVYAASSSGIYKINDYITGSHTWVKHDYGTEAQDMGTIVADPYFPFNFLAGTSPEAEIPMIWASGDSGRSWNQLYNGVLDVDNAIINKLDASQNGDVANAQFVVGTDKGSYYLPNPFKHGFYEGNQYWGPGTVIVNGDVLIDGDLQIDPPCTVLVEYNFDVSNIGGEDQYRSGIYIFGGLTARGSEDAQVLFTSSRPTNKTAGDWTGIVFMKTGTGSPVDISYCSIKYAVKGIFDFDNVNHTVFNMTHSTVKRMTTAGIDLFATSSTNGMQISSCLFDTCGSFGIRIRKDDNPGFPRADILSTSILDCANGVSYSGNGYTAGGTKYLNIKDCTIMRRTSGIGNHGLYLVRYGNDNTRCPTFQITENVITNFAQAGIYLANSSSSTTLTKNKVNSNGTGLFVASSNPRIIGTSQIDYNVFCFNTQNGISFDKNSGGFIRWANIKQNTINGVLIDSHDITGAQLPDFGQPDNQGFNSIHKNIPSPGQS